MASSGPVALNTLVYPRRRESGGGRPEGTSGAEHPEDKARRGASERAEPPSLGRGPFLSRRKTRARQGTRRRPGPGGRGRRGASADRGTYLLLKSQTATTQPAT